MQRIYCTLQGACALSISFAALTNLKRQSLQAYVEFFYKLRKPRSYWKENAGGWGGLAEETKSHWDNE